MKALLALAVLAAAAVLVLVPAVASASDQSVYQAYSSHDSDLGRLGRKLKRDTKVWVDSGHRRQRPALQTLAKMRKLTLAVSRAVKPEAPSSADGKRAKAAALASMRYLRGSLSAAGRAMRAATAGHAKSAKRYANKTGRLLSRFNTAFDRARKYFKAAGVAIKSDRVSP